MKKIILTAVAIVMASAAPSLAQTYRADSREVRQDTRIIRGAVRGDLTRKETRKVIRQQNRIDRAQNRSTRDGVVTVGEQRRIERMQDRASRNIARKTHNNRVN